MTKSALADACGISSMAISNYEKGIRNPDMEIINKLAKALDVKIADFLEVRNASINFEHRGFRKHSALPKGTQVFIREAVEEYFNRFFNAVECVGGNPLPEPIKCGSLIPSGDYAADAKALRTELGFPQDGPIKGLKTVLENKGILVLEVEVGNNKFSGMNGTVNGYPYVVVNKEMTEERIRSTIAHELVHVMFDLPQDMDEEEFANKISGAFLISRTDLERELGLKRKAVTNDFILVCKEYGVSMLLLVLRAKQAGKELNYIANQTNRIARDTANEISDAVNRDYAVTKFRNGVNDRIDAARDTADRARSNARNNIDLARSRVNSGINSARRTAGRVRSNAENEFNDIQRTARRTASRAKSNARNNVDLTRSRVNSGINSARRKVNSGINSAKRNVNNARYRAENEVNRARSNANNNIDLARSRMNSGINSAKRNVNNARYRAENEFNDIQRTASRTANRAKSRMNSGINSAKRTANNAMNETRSRVNSGVNYARNSVNRARSNAENEINDIRRTASRTVNRARSNANNNIDLARSRVNSGINSAKRRAKQTRNNIDAGIYRLQSAPRTLKNKARYEKDLAKINAKNTVRNAKYRLNKALHQPKITTNTPVDNLRNSVDDVNKKLNKKTNRKKNSVKDLGRKKNMYIV